MRIYATQKIASQNSDPNSAFQVNSQIEVFINDYKRKDYNPSSNNKNTIQVVVHVIHALGEDYPSEEDVNAQLEALNRDFGDVDTGSASSDIPAPFQAVAAKLNLNFCLATLENEPAVRYLSSGLVEWNAEQEAFKFSATGGANVVESKRYLNIWVVDLADGISGYSQWPGGKDDTDGIVIDPDFFGIKDPESTPYNEGKTLTHLVGSYLGLYELWNESIPCADDFVDDTPIHNGPNYMYSSIPHLSFCDGNPIEMTMNFMDNTDDVGLSMFTIGQKVRMLAVLSPQGPRKQLVKPDNICEDQENFKPETGIVPANASIVSGSLEIDKSETFLNVFPNPTHSLLRIELRKQFAEQGVISIFNTLGAQVFRTIVAAGQVEAKIELIVNNWPSGTYSLHWNTPTESIARKVVIVR